MKSAIFFSYLRDHILFLHKLLAIYIFPFFHLSDNKFGGSDLPDMFNFSRLCPHFGLNFCFGTFSLFFLPFKFQYHHSFSLAWSLCTHTKSLIMGHTCFLCLVCLLHPVCPLHLVWGKPHVFSQISFQRQIQGLP